MDLFKESRSGKKIYQISFPDGTRVPFVLLNWGDYVVFFEMFNKATVPKDIVEDIVFKQCVVESSVVAARQQFRAGIVSTIVEVIMLMSGPADINAFNQALDVSRQQVDSLQSQVEMIICRAFPCYKPEDLRWLQWPQLIQRLAQAERILMSRNPPELTEPIKLFAPGEQPVQKTPGKVDVNELVKDGNKMRAEGFAGENTEMPVKELSPRQMLQMQKLREMKSRR